MPTQKKTLCDKREAEKMKIISASAIGEFYYCRMAWWLRSKGITPQKIKDIEKQIKVTKDPEKKVKLIKQLKVSKKIEKNLKEGIKRHKKIGEKIVEVQTNEVQINYFKYVGYGILALIVLFIILALLK